MPFSFLFKCGFYLWHWTFSPPSRQHSFRGLKTALSFINSSLYFMCSVWKTTAWTGNTAQTETCFHSQCDSSEWTSMTTSSPSPHPSFSPRSSSSWEWGDEAIRGRLESVQDWEKMVICFTGQLIPHLTEWDGRNMEAETPLGWNTVPLDHTRF